MKTIYSLFVQTDTAQQTQQMPMDPIQYQLYPAGVFSFNFKPTLIQFEKKK